jgi:hypothetical protein
MSSEVPYGGTPEGRRAADVFSLSLRPRPGGRVRHGLRLAGAFASQMTGQLVPSPAVHDLVVIRRTDNAEVLRVPAEDPLTVGDLVAYMREQLEELDEEAFLAEWQSRAGS